MTFGPGIARERGSEKERGRKTNWIGQRCPNFVCVRVRVVRQMPWQFEHSAQTTFSNWTTFI